MLAKISAHGSFSQVARGTTIEKYANEKSIENKSDEFLYFRAKFLHACPNLSTERPIVEANIKGFCANGNGDVFPHDEVLKSYASFTGRHVDLNHQTDRLIGKIIDVYMVEEKNNDIDEIYVEGLCKVDKKAEPQIARQIETGILDCVSMEASVASSDCSICGNVIHNELDKKCEHFIGGLNKESEIGGVKIKCYSINRGITFTGLGVVNIPADNDAKVLSIISELKDRLTTTSAIDTAKQTDILAQLNELIASLTPENKKKVQACVCEKPKTESVVDEALRKISGFEYIKLADYFKPKSVDITEKAETPVAVEMTQITASTTATVSATICEACVEIKSSIVVATATATMTATIETKVEEKKEGVYKSVFIKKADTKQSYYLILKESKPIMRVVLSKIWNAEDLKKYESYITDEKSYGNNLVAYIEKEGLEKLSKLMNENTIGGNIKMEIKKEVSIDEKIAVIKKAMNFADDYIEKLKVMAAKCPNCFNRVYDKISKKEVKADVVKDIKTVKEEVKIADVKKDSSAFDLQDPIIIGDGYLGTKDKDTKELIIKDKAGKEVDRFPDAFGDDIAVIIKFFRTLYKLDKKPEDEVGLPKVNPTEDKGPKIEETPSEQTKEEKPLAEVETVPASKKVELVVKSEKTPEEIKKEKIEEKKEIKEEKKEDKEKADKEAKEKKEKEEKEAKEKKEKEEKEAKEKAEKEKKAALEAEEKIKKALEVKNEKISKLIELMANKGLIEADPKDLEYFQKEGFNILDCRKSALKKAVETQKATLLKMDDSSIEAFAKSIGLIKKASIAIDSSLSSIIMNMKVETSKDGWLENLKWS
jgi:hypothetical protein